MLGILFLGDAEIIRKVLEMFNANEYSPDTWTAMYLEKKIAFFLCGESQRTWPVERVDQVVLLWKLGKNSSVPPNEILSVWRSGRFGHSGHPGHPFRDPAAPNPGRPVAVIAVIDAQSTDRTCIYEARVSLVRWCVNQGNLPYGEADLNLPDGLRSAIIAVLHGSG
ncbi:MAG: hypothetical protein ACYCOU_12760 [Sulfobacillus sp.]